VLVHGVDPAESSPAQHLVYTLQAAQFCMARAWGEISDAVGRKPCLLCSALGTSVLHFALATSPTLWPLFVAICLEGATSTAYSASQVRVDKHTLAALLLCVCGVPWLVCVHRWGGVV